MKFPVHMKAVSSGLIVLFTSRTIGTVVASGTSPHKIGMHHTAWIACDDSHWEPIASKKSRIMARIKDFK